MRDSSAKVTSAFVGRVSELGLVTAFFLGVTLLRFADRPPLGDGLDGAYYLNIARHVAAGRGLVTSLSIYHAGLETLPSATVAYPLLPLLLGGLARFVGLEWAARAVPACCYVASLVLLYVWLRVSLARWLPSPRLWAPGVAFGATALLALNPVFGWASSRPYTESLALLLVFATLLAYSLARRRQRCVGRDGAVFLGVGVLAGLAYLARFQLVVVVVALVVVELAGRDAARFRRVAWLLLGALVPMGAWAQRVLGLPHAGLRDLLDFARYRALPALPPFEYEVPCSGAVACVGDKLAGVAAAFSPAGSTSYVAQFGVVAYAIPIALVVVPWLHRRGVRWRALRRARHADLVASALMGVLAVAPIHLVHSEHWYEWAFGWRQGLPLVLLLVPALAVLLAAFRAPGATGPAERLTRKAVSALAASLLVVSLVTLGTKAVRGSDAPLLTAGLEGSREAAEVLQHVALHERTLGIEPQPVAAFTDAPLDWLACWSEPVVAEVLVRERHVTRALLRPGELSCRSLARIRGQLRLEAVVGHRHEFGLFTIVNREPPR